MSDDNVDRFPPGPGVDSEGRPVVDPTRNVLDLVAAAIKRQDDLRETESRHVREIAGLRADYTVEIARLRASFQEELRSAETERINAIRTVDVQAVQQAAGVAEARATALANQVAASAEALRNQVQAAASAAAVSLATALEPIQKDIADLRRAQYEQQGQRAQVQEGRAGIGTTTAIVGAIVAVVVLAFSLYVGLRGTRTQPSPVVVTVPATP